MLKIYIYTDVEQRECKNLLILLVLLCDKFYLFI